MFKGMYYHYMWLKRYNEAAAGYFFGLKLRSSGVRKRAAVFLWLVGNGCRVSYQSSCSKAEIE